MFADLRRLAGGCLCACAALMISGCGGSPIPTPTAILHYYAPTGFVAMANALIRQGKIHYSCEDDKIHLNIGEGTPEYDWYLESYLKEDVERFNDSQQRFADLFIVDGCQLISVNPYAHRVPLPETAADQRRWDGDLTYARQSVVGTLRSDRQTVSIVAPAGPVTAADVEVVPVLPPKLRPDPVSGIVAKFFFNAPGNEAADVYAIGTSAVIQDRRDAGFRDRELLLKGRPLPSGRIAALEDGDWLQFVQRRGRATYQYSTRDLAGMLSWAGIRNRSLMRVTENNSLGFVDDLVRGMDVVYRRLGEERSNPPQRFGIELTVRRGLQQETTAALQRFVETKLPERGHPRRAGLTVLDMFSGEALALASYPATDEEIEDFGYLSPGERRRLLSNQNFARHPIGSAGKPFWMTAIVNEYPFLASFTVRAHTAETEYPTAIGYPLGDRGYETHNHPFEVGIDRGLEVSCNKLMIDLATAALGVDAGVKGQSKLRSLPDAFRFTQTPMPEGDRFSVCGETATTIPALDRHLKEGNKLVLLDQNPIFGALGRLTGARMFSELAPEGGTRTEAGGELLGDRYRDARFHLAPWGDLLATLQTHARSEQSSRLIHASVGAVSPEAVNLGINKVDGLRSEWISILLGGASASWNNVQLAEALSRLVTGRAVQARFQQAVGADGEIVATPRAAALTDLDERARRLVLLGMNRVVSHGTASAVSGLEARLEREFPGYRAHVFGKTGTPAVQGFFPRDLMRLIARMYRGDPNVVRTTQDPRAGIAYDPARRRVLITSTGERILRSVSPAMAERFQNIVRDMNSRIEDYRVEHNQPPPGAFPLYLEEELLRFNEGARTAWNSKGAVFMMGIVLTPRRDAYTGPVPECLPAATQAAVRTVPAAADLNERSIGLSVVAYLEDVPTTSVLAVDFVGGLEETLVGTVRERMRAGAGR